MTADERALRMVMLDWPQEKVNKYNELKKEIYDNLIAQLNSAENEDDKEVFMAALALSYLDFGKYVESL